MPDNPYRRRSIRIKDYNYTESGAYFVTICALNRQCLFGKIIDSAMILSEAGRIVEKEWLNVEVARCNVKLDLFVVMPNHFHAILWIDGNKNGTASCAPTPQRFGHVVSGSLSAIIRGFKAGVTNRYNKVCEASGKSIWQRNYYEHVIRNDESLGKIREYIINNPLSWGLDKENPGRQGEHAFYCWLESFRARPEANKIIMKT